MLPGDFNAWHVFVIASLLVLCSAIVYVVQLNRELRAARRVLEKEVSDRLRAQAQLAINEERLRKIIETEPECVKVQGQDGIILEMNPAGLRLVDATAPEQIVGTSIYDLVAPDFVAAYRALTLRVFRGETDTLEFQIVSLKNRHLWMETHAAPLKDCAGNVTALLAVTRDISARRHHEHQMRLQFRELAHASRLDTMEQMATMLAHELNQPLTAIANYARGALRRLKSGRDLTDVERVMEQVCNQADRAASIIRSLRRYMSNGNCGPIPISVDSVIRDAISIANVEAQSQNVRIFRTLSSALPLVGGEVTQLEQVILNVMRNGIEAMQEVPICERVLNVETSLSTSGMVRLSISDAGMGQDCEDLESMFQPFFTTKRNGMGLGLCISRSIVESHGGRLSAIPNTSDRGLTFVIDLPPLEEGRVQ